MSAAGDKSITVSIIIGSASDDGAMEPCRKALASFAIPFEQRVLSAHRAPEELRAYVQGLSARGAKLVIAAAGMAAHLPGVVAAHTRLPVLGVPLAAGPLQGFDALLSIVQMPGGVPVACMSVGSAGAKNAAYLAARVLALTDAQVAERMATVLEADKQKALGAAG